MAIFSISRLTSNVTTSQACLEIIASTTVSHRILEIGLIANTAPTGPAYGLGAPAAVGVTPTTPNTVIGEDQNNTTAGTTNTALAWATGPTAPANFFRRVTLPSAVGAGIIWTFPRGMKIPKSNTSVIWNIAGTITPNNIWVVVDE